MSKASEKEIAELTGRSPDELLRLLREALAEDLGDEIAEKSTLHYSGGWFYFNQARRFGDGSVGTIGPSSGKRRKDIATLILTHRSHAKQKQEQSKGMRHDFGSCVSCKAVGQVYHTKKGWHCVHCLWRGEQE